MTKGLAMQRFVHVFVLALIATAACAASPAAVGEADESLSTVEASASADVQIIVEPGDHDAALVSAIQQATKSVHMTMYLLTAPDVISALVARHQAGVDVRIILNEHFSTPGNGNQTAFDTLTAAGISVVWAETSFTYTHEKCVVIDGKTAWIMTMNATKTSPTENREFLAIDTTHTDVVEAEAQFTADFAHTPYTPTGNLLMSPVSARPGIVSLLGTAQHSIDFEVEEVSDTGIVTAMCAAAGRHVSVRGVIPSGSQTSTVQRAVAALKTCGVTLVARAHPYPHAKAIVVDGARAYVGSANFSPTSLDRNRELGLVTSNAAAVATVATTVAGDIKAGTAL
jgi:cardiolipin synthase A/B